MGACMLNLDPPLPHSDVSMPFAVFRLQEIATEIRRSFRDRARADAGSGDAYSHFRARAYLLLAHYVDNGFPDAFRWLLMMNGDAPKKTRITLDQNPFHWGLRAMSSAAGTFMSPNKLRDLGTMMKRAHSEGVLADDFETYVRRRRSHDRTVVTNAVLPQAEEREGPRRRPVPPRYRRRPLVTR